MINLTTLMRPEVLKLIGRKLTISLAISAMIVLPGIFLTLSGYRLPGMAWSFTGSFLLMARSYRKPWGWNPIIAFVPPVVAALSLLFQVVIIGNHFPSFIWFAVAALFGLVFGWQRGKSHRLYFEKDRLMADRTVAYLLLWALSYFLTSMVSFFGQMWMVAPAILTGTFSTAMLATVALALFGKARRMERQGGGSEEGRRRPLASATSVLLIGLAMSLTSGDTVWACPITGPIVQEDSTATMTSIGRESVDAAAGYCKGLIEQKSDSFPLSAGNGTTVRIDADFNVQLDDYVTDTHSRVDITKFNDAQTARKQAEAQLKVLKRLSIAEKYKDQALLQPTTVRGELSYQSIYAPQSGGQGHRAIVQQGPWLIDVDTVAWDPGTDKNRGYLATNQMEITFTIASQVFDKGVEAGLISLEPTPIAGESVPATQPANTTPDVLSTVPASPEIVNIEDFTDPVPEEELIDPVDIEVLTALIALVLIAGGMTVDAATAIANAIAEGMLEGLDVTDQELDEIDAMTDSIVAEEPEGDEERQPPANELSDDEKAARRRAAQQQIRENEGEGTVDLLDPTVLWEGMRDSGKDVVEVGRELADLAPVVVETVAETAADVAAFHPSSLDLARMAGVFGDLQSAGRGLHDALSGLAQLAGDQFATRIDQDPEVLAALELLAIVSRLQSVPGAALTDGSTEELQRLLTERGDEVRAGLDKIGQLAGNAAWFAVRNAVGAQEWENAVNGDLSPLTRVANALLASAQSAGVLHSAGTSLAGRFAGAAEGVADAAHVADATESLSGARRAANAGEGLTDASHLDDLPTGRVPGYADELADGSRPRQGWPGLETRRNPVTGAIERRTSPNEPFRPLPDDVADAMRNQPINKGEFRLNPDTGDIEWRNPNTGVIERAPEKIPGVNGGPDQYTGYQDRRPGYEQSPLANATGRDAGLRNLPEGAVIPDEMLPQTGYAPRPLEELARVAREEKVIFGGRTTNMDALRHIADKTGTPKPVYIKSKTIQDIDRYLGADPNDVGLVGYFEPKKVPSHQIPVDKQALVELRYKERLAEFNELRSDVEKLKSQGIIAEEGGKLHRVMNDGKKIPFAGDIDPAYIRDAKTGKVLSGDRYLEVLDKFKNSGAEIQHGSEFNMSADLLRNSQPGTPEYEKAVRKMAELHAKLERAHTSGKEIVVEMWPDGKLRRGAALRGLGMEV